MRVVLAADGSVFTTSAIAFLRRLSFPEGSELSVLTVVPSSEGRESEEDRACRDEAGEAAEAALQQSVDEASQLGLPISHAIRTGRPTTEIIQYGIQTQADLVVVGSHGRRGLRRFLLGSVALKVVTFAPMSVLIVRPGDDDASDDGAPVPPLRVIIATDGSDQAEKAIARFAELAAGGWCHIRVVTVLELITAYHMNIRQRLSASWRERKIEANRHLQEVSARLAPLAAEMDTRILEAENASEAILDMADEFSADLIVIGGTGKGHVERVFLGSVASRVARYAQCSVWIGR